MPRPPANIIPHTANRIGEALAAAPRAQERAGARHAPFDGDGAYLEGVVVPASSNKVLTHNLGRVPRGWIVMGLSATTSIAGFTVPREHRAGRNAKTISLNNDSTTDVTIDLWIF